MNLLDVLQVKDRELICLVGGGGKTTTMYALAKALNLKGKNVAISTTTSIYYPSKEEVDKFIVEENTEKLHKILCQNVRIGGCNFFSFQVLSRNFNSKCNYIA